MKKANYFLSTLLVIFLIGILLTVAGICSGARLFSFETENNESLNAQSTLGPTTLSEAEAATINGLKFNLKASSAKLIQGDSYSIDGDGHYNTYVKDGIWYVETQYNKAHISFLSRKITIPAFWENWDDDDSDLIITIPSNKHFSSASIQLAAGEIAGERLAADEIIINSGAGELDFRELTSGKLNLKVGAGDANIHKIFVQKSCDIKVGAGEITLGSEDNILSDNNITNLNGECAAGEIYFAGKLSGDVDLDCATGEIQLLLDGNRNNYNIDSSGALTEINIENSSRESNDSDSTTKNKEQYANLSLDCSLGEIDVEFEE